MLSRCCLHCYCKSLQAQDQSDKGTYKEQPCTIKSRPYSRWCIRTGHLGFSDQPSQAAASGWYRCSAQWVTHTAENLQSSIKSFGGHKSISTKFPTHLIDIAWPPGGNPRHRQAPAMRQTLSRMRQLEDLDSVRKASVSRQLTWPLNCSADPP